MEQKRALELCQNLQAVLQLPSSFCTMVNDDPLFVDALYQQLKDHQDKLEQALQSAFPDEEDLKKLIETGLNESFAKITDGTSYARRVSHTVDWAFTQGYLLELIAAARQRNQRNTLLRVFIVNTLKPLIEANMPTSKPEHAQALPEPTPAQAPPLQPFSPPNEPFARANGNNPRGASTNGHQQLPSGDHTARIGTNVVADDTPVFEEEEEQTPTQKLPIPLPTRPDVVENQLARNQAITQSLQNIEAARKAIQLVCDMFQHDERIDGEDAIQQVNEAREQIGKIPALVAHIPVPDYPDLHFGLESEQTFFSQQARLVVLSLQAIKNQPPPPSFLLSIETLLTDLLQSLRDAESLMGEFTQQVNRLEQANEQQYETGA